MKDIQELARHESIQSAMGYANVSSDHLKEVADRVNYGPMPSKSFGKGLCIGTVAHPEIRNAAIKTIKNEFLHPVFITPPFPINV